MQTCPTPATYPDRGRVAQLLRGGSWNNNPRNCRSAYRNHNEPDNANNNIGFRVVCLPQHPSPSEPLEGIPAGAPEGCAPVVHGLAIDVGSAPFFSLPNAVHAHLAELKP